MSAIAVELFVIVFALAVYIFMKKFGYRDATRKFFIIFIGVLLFEIISEPLWINSGFDAWAYIYRDITWVLTLGWTAVFLIAIMLTDYSFQKLPEKVKFFMYTAVISVLVLPFEIIMLNIGVRGYAPFLTERLSGLMVPLTQVPLEGLYASPIFIMLVLAFYKYMNYMIETK